MVGVVYGIVLRREFISGWVLLGLKLALVHFLLSGVAAASACKAIAEALLRKEEKRVQHAQASSIEPLYAFDIHCNAFFPFFVFAYVAQVRTLSLLFIHTSW